jgi:hypothetical protein
MQLAILRHQATIVAIWREVGLAFDVGQFTGRFSLLPRNFQSEGSDCFVPCPTAR